MQRFHIHRFEFKYLIDLSQYAAIRKELLNYACHDPYSLRYADRCYYVYSLYYDSPQYTAFWEKTNGIKDRKKFRFRVYDTDPQHKPDVYLEIKRKRDSVTIKDRAKINYNDYTVSGKGNHYNLLRCVGMPEDQRKVIEELLYNIANFRFSPALIVAYRREALFGKHHQNIRITFDMNIKTHNSIDLFAPYTHIDTVTSREVVLELKFNGTLPGWFHHLIQKYDLVRETYSKYCSSFIRLHNMTV